MQRAEPARKTGAVTIHRGDPFATPEPERSPLRRFRGRMPAPVSVWAAAIPGRRPETPGIRAGWTLSSFLVADGEPAEVLGVLDDESPLADLLGQTSTVAISLLGWEQRGVADAFAQVAPAPGGPFTVGSWLDGPWGPVLEGAAGWIGARLTDSGGRAGWGILVRGAVEHVEIGPDPEGGLLSRVRGRYRALTG